MQTGLVVIVFLILFDLQEYVNIPEFLFSLLGAGKAGKWWQVWERPAHARFVALERGHWGDSQVQIFISLVQVQQSHFTY